MLTMQFRMQSSIAYIVSHTSYKAELTTGVLNKDRIPPSGFPWPQQGIGCCWVNVDGEEEGSRINRLEPNTAILIALNLLVAGERVITGEHILILTSYGAQKTHIMQKNETKPLKRTKRERRSMHGY